MAMRRIGVDADVSKVADLEALIAAAVKPSSAASTSW